jgi:hypothetical protein
VHCDYSELFIAAEQVKLGVDAPSQAEQQKSKKGRGIVGFVVLKRIFSIRKV